MKKCLLLNAVCIFLCTDMFAQLGFTFAPTRGMASEWQVLTENYLTQRHTDLLKYGFTATVDYTIDLKASEWEFRPAFHFMRSTFLTPKHDFSIHAVGVQTNFNFIPLKDAQKREWPGAVLYFQFSPGIDYVKMRYSAVNTENGTIVREEKTSDTQIALNGGLNLLLDLHLTDLLMVSPMVGVRYFPNLEWTGFTRAVSNGDFTHEYDQINWRHVVYGLRIGLNLHDGKD